MIPLMVFVQNILTSKLFWALAITYFLTHGVKLLTQRYQAGNWSCGPLWETGGMPSSHSAIVVALAVGIAFDAGASPVLFLAIIFALIVIRDSVGMRASVGEQARILNVLTGKLNVHKKARTVLGHTPAQVLVGCLLGALVTIAVYLLL